MLSVNWEKAKCQKLNWDLLFSYKDVHQQVCIFNNTFPGNNYLFKANSSNTRKRCDVCSKITIKRLE